MTRFTGLSPARLSLASIPQIKDDERGPQVSQQSPRWFVSSFRALQIPQATVSLPKQTGTAFSSLGLRPCIYWLLPNFVSGIILETDDQTQQPWHGWITGDECGHRLTCSGQIATQQQWHFWSNFPQLLLVLLFCRPCPWALFVPELLAAKLLTKGPKRELNALHSGGQSSIWPEHCQEWAPKQSWERPPKACQVCKTKNSPGLLSKVIWWGSSPNTLMSKVFLSQSGSACKNISLAVISLVLTSQTTLSFLPLERVTFIGALPLPGEIYQVLVLISPCILFHFSCFELPLYISLPLICSSV